MKEIIYILFLVVFSNWTSAQESDELNSRIEKTEKVSFKYKVLSLDLDSKRMTIRATIRNTSSDTINFLTYSCNGLESNIYSDEEVLSKYYDHYCNASFPMSFQLSPNQRQTIEIGFNLISIDEIYKIGFDFRQLNAYYSMDELEQKQPMNDFDYDFEDIIIESRIIWANSE